MNQNPTSATPSPNTSTPTANPFDGMVVQSSGTEPLPCGAYYADFHSVEAFSNDKVSDKFKWIFTVSTGPQTTALTDKRITPNTHAGRLITGLIGRPLVAGEDMGKLWSEMQQAIGQRFMVTVAAGPKGGKPSVQGVTKPPVM